MQAVQCGLTIEKFWQITWRDFSIYRIAHERNQLITLVTTRELIYAQFQTAGKSFESLPSKENFWPLPVDRAKEQAKPLTKEEIAIVMERYTRKQVVKE